MGARQHLQTQSVTLRFDYRAPMRGANRYYTTLSFGI